MKGLTPLDQHFKARRRAIQPSAAPTHSASEPPLPVSENNLIKEKCKRRFKCNGITKRYHHLPLWFVVIAAAIPWYFLTAAYWKGTSFEADSNRSLSVQEILPALPKSVGPCNDLTYSSPSRPHRPVWIASYPGSGSEIVQELVETLTGGIVGGSVYMEQDPPFMDCVTARAATCKTHWPILPFHSPHSFRKGEYDDHSIVLVRNPIHAFSSRWNHLWEVNTHQKRYTKQAPEKSWNRYIRKHWKSEIEAYQELLQAWTNHSLLPKHQTDLILSYEDLTSPVRGAEAVEKLVHVLEKANVRTVQDPESIKCLWNYTVLTEPKRKRAKHKYIPGYTKNHKERILEMIEKNLLEPLLQKVQFSEHQKDLKPSPVDRDLVRVFQGYQASIANTTRIVEYKYYS